MSESTTRCLQATTLELHCQSSCCDRADGACRVIMLWPLPKVCSRMLTFGCMISMESKYHLVSAYLALDRLTQETLQALT